MTSLELLAPARNADIGINAISCGADAVYIGGPAFGARAAAGNSVEDIQRLCAYASRYGAKVFVTVNTLCRSDDERRSAVQMMLDLKDRGVSAFIMQDCTLLPLLREKGPWREEFHASTQCAIRTPERARELHEMGFTRLVLEREMSLAQIRAIKDAVPDAELEFFVHGALCVCYSGDCYLSELLAGRSANRGECAQPCRSLYDLLDSDGRVLCANKPLLSLKDYCLIDRMEDLARAGVVSFKIEGRLKNASYVKNVVRAYSMKLDEIVSSGDGLWCRSSRGKVCGGFTPDLDKTFNRAYTQLFLDGRRGQWHSGDAAKHMGQEIGRVKAVGRDFIETDGNIRINNGDGLCTVISAEVAGWRADRVEGRRIFCKLPSGLKPGMKLWRNRDVEFERQLENNMPQRMIEVGLDVKLCAGSMEVQCKSEGMQELGMSFDLSAFDTALSQERSRVMIQTQLSKSAGIYLFKLLSLSADGPLPVLPASFLNGIRRTLADELEKLPLPQKEAVCAVPSALDPETLKHPRREGELMRTKYCIRYMMGLCPKEGGAKKAAQGLVLRNNGRLLPLHFDCRACEMVVGKPVE